MAEKFSIIKFLEGKNYYGYDKHLHVFISAVLAIIFISFFNFLIGAVLALSVGLVKELFDLIIRKENFKWSVEDFLADIFGVLLGIIIVFFCL